MKLHPHSSIRNTVATPAAVMIDTTGQSSQSGNDTGQFAPLVGITPELMQWIRARSGVHHRMLTRLIGGRLFATLVLRGDEQVCLLCLDCSRADVRQWLSASVRQGHIPVVLHSGEKAISVRLKVDETVDHILHSRPGHPATAAELQSAAGSLFEQLSDGSLLRTLDIPTGHCSVSVAVLGGIDD